MEAWKLGSLVLGGFEAWRLAAWRLGCLDVWRRGGLEAWRLGGLAAGAAWTLETRSLGRVEAWLEAWRLGGLDVWVFGGLGGLGGLEAWRLRGSEAWRLGGLDAWRLGGRLFGCSFIAWRPFGSILEALLGVLGTSWEHFGCF